MWDRYLLLLPRYICALADKPHQVFDAVAGDFDQVNIITQLLHHIDQGTLVPITITLGRWITQNFSTITTPIIMRNHNIPINQTSKY